MSGEAAQRKAKKKANPFRGFKTSERREQEGVPIRIFEPDSGEFIVFKVARPGRSNVEYTKAVERLAGEDRRRRTLREALDLQREAFVETCILGWEAFDGPDGNPFEYSKANLAILAEALPELIEQLFADASERDIWLAKHEAEEEKNL